MIRVGMPAASANLSPPASAELEITRRMLTGSSPSAARSIKFFSVRPLPDMRTAIGSGSVLRDGELIAATFSEFGYWPRKTQKGTKKDKSGLHVFVSLCVFRG